MPQLPHGGKLYADRRRLIIKIVDTLKRRGLLNINKNGKIALATVALKYGLPPSEVLQIKS